MNKIDDDLLSLSMCILKAHSADCKVDSVSSSSVILPSGETTWDRLYVSVSDGPIRPCFTMFRSLRDDGEETPELRHLCTEHNGSGVASMVAICQWRNENVIQNPHVWKFFQPRLTHWCQIEDSKFEYTFCELVRWWTKWGIRLPNESLLPCPNAVNNDGWNDAHHKCCEVDEVN